MLAQSNQSESDQNLNADQLSDIEQENEVEVVSGDDDGNELFWDVVVRIQDFQMSDISSVAKSSGLTPQFIMERYICLGVLWEECRASGDYSDLERHFGLTRYVAK